MSLFTHPKSRLTKLLSTLLSGVLLLTLGGSLSQPAYADNSIGYAGRLTDASGAALTGEFTFRFTLWDDAQCNANSNYLSWTELATVVADAEGYFRHQIRNLPDITGSYLRIEVKRSGDPDSSFEVLDPAPSDPELNCTSLFSGTVVQISDSSSQTSAPDSAESQIDTSLFAKLADEIVEFAGQVIAQNFTIKEVTNCTQLGTDADGIIGCRPDRTGGTPFWGGITGTLSSQTDLQAALDSKMNAGVITSLGTVTTGNVDAIVTADSVGLGDVTNESKATMFTSPTFTGTVTLPSGLSGLLKAASGVVSAVTEADYLNSNVTLISLGAAASGANSDITSLTGVNSITVGGGYGNTGTTLDADGNLFMDGNLTLVGSINVADVTFYDGNQQVADTLKVGVGSAGTDTDYLLVDIDGHLSDNDDPVTVSDDLEVTGQVKISGGTPGAGKILTSDASGLATWETLVTGPFATAGSVTSNSAGSYASDDFVFGSPSLNYDSDGTHASRFFFDKDKRAFRAGNANGTAWDSASIGDYSVALGNNTIASANYATAFGSGTTASGAYSTALGSVTTASALYSTALGSSTTASASYATALGRSSTASNDYALATGWGTIASGLGSTAFGGYTTASNEYAAAFGGWFVNNQKLSLAVGRGANASDANPAGLVRLEADADQDGTKKSAIYLASTAGATSATNRLENRSGTLYFNGSPISAGGGISNIVEDTTPQLGGDLDVNGNNITSAAGLDIAIGASAGNDFTIDTSKLVVEGDTGNIGIGIASPDEKLTIAAGNIHLDSDTNVDVKIDRSAANRRSTVTYQTAGVSNWFTGLADSDEAGDGSEFFIGQSVGGSSPKFWIETNGNIGIGNTGPDTELHVQGGVCIDTDAACTDPGDGNLYVAGSIETACPAGFTSIKAGSNQLGCMQTAEEGSATWQVANDDCFDTYGGRLPLATESFIAFENYAFTDEGDDWEWMSDIDSVASNTAIVHGNYAAGTFDTVARTLSRAYRCWIPR